MKKIVRKSLSLILALILCCSLPISVLADDAVPAAEPVVEEIEIDFTGDKVPSVSVTVTPGTSNEGSADASDLIEETVQGELNQIENNLPEEGLTFNPDGSFSYVDNEPILDENGKVIGYNSTTMTNSVGSSLEITTKGEEIKTDTETDRNLNVSMGNVQNNGSGNPADWNMESIETTVKANASIDTVTDLRKGSSIYNYSGEWDAIDWENHAFAYTGGALSSRILADLEGNYELPYSNAGIFIIQNEAGEKFYAYCTDLDTAAELGESYDMLNVEDATYFTDEEAAHIRFIAMNGYWGTEGYETNEAGEVITDAEGNPVPKTGSLEAVKNMMRNATDEEGNALFTEDQIDLLTDGMALTVTQAAIWVYGNSSEEYGIATEGAFDSGAVFTGTWWSSIRASNDDTDIAKKNTEVRAEQVERESIMLAETSKHFVSDEKIEVMQALFEYMTAQSEQATEDSTVITKDNAFASTTITVNNQVSTDLNLLTEHAPKNYNVDVAFTLGVVPGEDDTLKVEIYQLDANGDVVMKDGAPVVLSSVAVETGKTDYTVEGLELPNGSSITLNLSGVNNLDQGVYLYSALSYEQTQTMVGIAEGDQAVDLSVDLSFEVEEPELRKEKVVKTEVFVQPETPPTTPPTPPTDIPEEPTPLDPNPPVPPQNPPQNPPQELEDIDEDPVPLEDMPDEEVPLAAVPQTGDSSIIFAVLSALSGTGLAGLALTKKKDEE